MLMAFLREDFSKCLYMYTCLLFVRMSADAAGQRKVLHLLELEARPPVVSARSEPMSLFIKCVKFALLITEPFLQLQSFCFNAES